MKRGNRGRELTERQELALGFLALVEDRSLADIRRQAIADLADELLTDPLFTDAVRSALRYRREHGVGRPITNLRSIR